LAVKFILGLCMALIVQADTDKMNVVSASGCGRDIQVDGPVTISLADSSVEDCQWSFRSRPDRVLMFIMQNAEELVQSIQIHDGFSTTTPLLFPSEAARSEQNSSVFHVYTSGSLAFVRYTARSSSDRVVKFTVQPAVNCPVNIGIQTSCARVLNDGGCHCVSWTARTWAVSRGFCELNGMQLVSFETKEEETAIENTWTNADLSVYYWTSGSDEGHEGRWVWTSTGKQLNYTNWHQAAPNNDGPEHYLHKNYDRTSKWNDIPVTTTMYAICEAMP